MKAQYVWSVLPALFTFGPCLAIRSDHDFGQSYWLCGTIFWVGMAMIWVSFGALYRAINEQGKAIAELRKKLGESGNNATHSTQRSDCAGATA